MANRSIDVAATGQSVVHLIQDTTNTLTIAAPFIKAATLQQLLSHLADGVHLRVLTRWHLTELLAGVSDLEVWPTVRERNGQLRLLPSLHTKAFMNHVEVLIGSANVTATALGWTSRPNHELLAHPADTESLLVRQEIEVLWGNGTPVSDRIHARFVNQLGQFETPQSHEEAAFDEPSTTSWLPTTRDPADIERFHLNGETAVTSGTARTARTDLSALEASPALDRPQLNAHIDLALLQHPVVTELRTMLATRRRFGEVAGFIADTAGLERQEANTAWQTLMRWLIHFQPDDWQYGKPRHSEILLYIG